MPKLVRTPDGNYINADHVAVVQVLADGRINLHMSPFGAGRPQGPYAMTADEFAAAAAGEQSPAEEDA